MKSESEPFSNPQQPGVKVVKSWKGQGDTKDTIPILPNLSNLANTCRPILPYFPITVICLRKISTSKLSVIDSDKLQ